MKWFKKVAVGWILFADDLFMLLGVLCFLIATFALSTIAGIYLLGVFFMLFAVFFARRPQKPPKKTERG